MRAPAREDLVMRRGLQSVTEVTPLDGRPIPGRARDWRTFGHDPKSVHDGLEEALQARRRLALARCAFHGLRREDEESVPVDPLDGIGGMEIAHYPVYARKGEEGIDPGGRAKRRLRNASGKAETQQEISESRHLWSLFHGTARRSSSAQRSPETTKARLANCGRSPKRAKVAYNIVYILVSTEIVGFS